jgi:hypothetical protein
MNAQHTNGSSNGARVRPSDHVRPAGASDADVAAAGKMSEAFEWIERARGRLYDFHQMMGRADFLFEEAADRLEAAGHGALGDEVRQALVGRNVLDGRWTFQIVEEFDDLYYAEARRCDRLVCDRLMAGRRHVYESELKEQRRTHGAPGHEARPPVIS